MSGIDRRSFLRGGLAAAALGAAGADTAFRVALGGHTMTVTHTDGYPVIPVQTGALLIGMGERYDVQVTLGDGVFPLALAEGKNSTALSVRLSCGEPPRDRSEDQFFSRTCAWCLPGGQVRLRECGKQAA